MMAASPRRWFGAPSGPGQPWEVGPASGPWGGWDDHFGSEGEVLEWRQEGPLVTALVREDNDYFRLLERPPVTNAITYMFDEAGLIEGLVIATVGERPLGRTDEFISWASEHEPDELRALMPGGEIDPSGDHPKRYRDLLVRWRAAAGLSASPHR